MIASVGTSVYLDGDAVVLDHGRGTHRFHPLWLLDHSVDPAHIDGVNGQRLFEPRGAPTRVESVDADDDELRVRYCDGVVASVPIHTLLVAAGARSEGDRVPTPRPWSTPVATPEITWDAIESSDRNALRGVLRSFHELGWFVITGAPIEPDSLPAIAQRFGRLSPTSFGPVFDVRTEPMAVDLAYTPVGLSLHTDQPYRRPTPGLQFLHTLVNTATGGESTVADGLAAVEALRRHDPCGAELLSRVMVEFRYDIGTDVVSERAPIIDLRPDGTLRQLRYSPRLDFVPALDFDTLDRFYAARRWLGEWLNDPRHTVEFKMRAGDVLVVDNHRVLHGRRPFDPTSGHRHLQGCYIDHDGPATMWRLLNRSVDDG